MFFGKKKEDNKKDGEAMTSSRFFEDRFNSMRKQLLAENQTSRDQKIALSKRNNQLELEQRLQSADWKQKIDLKEEYPEKLRKEIEAIEKEFERQKYAIKNLDEDEEFRREFIVKFTKEYGTIFYCSVCKEPGIPYFKKYHYNYSGEGDCCDADYRFCWHLTSNLSQCKVCDKLFCDDHIHKGICINCASK